MMIRRVRSALALSFLLCLASDLFAQATGTINGRVVDQDDAVLPGTVVNLRNVETSATRSTVTNEQGVYSVPALDRGTYEISVELTGFAPEIS
jgi:type 1 fimbria pilin